MQPIKNLIFDLGNVIVDLDLQTAENLIQQLTGISWREAKPKDLQVFLDFECGRIPEAVFLNYLIDRSGNKAQAFEIISAWNSMLVDIPLQRLLMLKRLKKEYKVFLLSNTNETHIRWTDDFLKKRHNLPSLKNLVHQAFYSYELHCRKPDEEIYQRVLSQTSAQARESLFFDDHPDNIRTAEALGIHTFLVDPRDEITEIVPTVLANFHAETN